MPAAVPQQSTRVLEPRPGGSARELRRLDPRVAEQVTDRIEVAVLLVEFHRDAMADNARAPASVADLAT